MGHFKKYFSLFQIKGILPQLQSKWERNPPAHALEIKI